MDYLENEISHLLQGYECGQRTDVSYAAKCREEMKALKRKFPADARIDRALKQMGEA